MESKRRVDTGDEPGTPTDDRRRATGDRDLDDSVGVRDGASARDGSDRPSSPATGRTHPPLDDESPYDYDALATDGRQVSNR